MAKKSFHRTDRVSAQLRRELGMIVHATVREHGLPSVSVSDVEVSLSTVIELNVAFTLRETIFCSWFAPILASVKM